ncbi:TPA: toll/interleukin-1 receptor domain-containing protein [Acinetobacter baumannii]|uniref:toll/interleukin-1 receptor domain-containing protein n=1 Tax=Acinetobacter baumannii TaxID=470 RepID=UPI001C5C7201|nr:toll/interleukin-1 receptor domain-containing protein [Acinetobacter baumannii]HAV6057377.1 toll/interleukin-1 receptor domain-containing protein [Acinetobacter baumannii]HAV6071762.1 toll/interleukin-1 receptor domain-containing protein [Acinetobacter baumannii]HAV6120836.1 toll/interleukin-1 receptor domain-containing protein [Acinetobacter baumannii]HAV6148473.1 toll/interleukin-1 receptor domain-containing protein [Acinetobacter baumannii]
MPVFISYRAKDREVALTIAQKLKANNIEFYLDVIDEESVNANDITEVITRNIKRCTHLMAIISPNTQGSWWVPFEIGEATVINRRICSFAYNTTGLDLTRANMHTYKNFLPEYLHKWPVLLHERELQNFIFQYKKDNENQALYDSLTTASTTFGTLSKRGADEFHKNLKAML